MCVFLSRKVVIFQSLTRICLSILAPVNERVVWDGNLVTGAGVSAGLDLGLDIIGRLKGDFFAESIQLLAEYDPKPKYQSGRLETAKLEVRNLMERMFVGYRKKIRAMVP